MSDNRVKIAVRVRPLPGFEQTRNFQTCIDLIPNKSQVQMKKTGEVFSFDYVFGPEDDQVQVYNGAVAKVVKNLFQGKNVSILAYGQTGSGKTYSMGSNYSGGESLGIIPRAVEEIFEKMKGDWNPTITVAFIEVYQEKIFDLLSGKPRENSVLEIRENIKGIRIRGLTEKTVKNVAETLASLAQGSLCRKTGSTNVNCQSSRSHAIFTITMSQQKGDDSKKAFSSKLQLVDLAGSESFKKSGATGGSFKECVDNNQGLLALGMVIDSLCRRGKSTFVPYRNSKLTRLLQDSLGGTAETLMLACISPANFNLEETVGTLRFACRTRKLANIPMVVDQQSRADEINCLKSRIEELEMLACPPDHGELIGEMKELRKQFVDLEKDAKNAKNVKNEIDGKILQIIEEFESFFNDEESNPNLFLCQIYKKIIRMISSHRKHYNTLQWMKKMEKINGSHHHLQKQFANSDKENFVDPEHPRFQSVEVKEKRVQSKKKIPLEDSPDSMMSECSPLDDLEKDPDWKITPSSEHKRTRPTRLAVKNSKRVKQPRI